jgi:hypothetical protein
VSPLPPLVVVGLDHAVVSGRERIEPLESGSAVTSVVGDAFERLEGIAQLIAQLSPRYCFDGCDVVPG